MNVEASLRSLKALQIKTHGRYKDYPAIEFEIIGSGMLEIVVFKIMEIENLELTIPISLSFDSEGTIFYLF